MDAFLTRSRRGSVNPSPTLEPANEFGSVNSSGLGFLTAQSETFQPTIPNAVDESLQIVSVDDEGSSGVIRGDMFVVGDSDEEDFGFGLPSQAQTAAPAFFSADADYEPDSDRESKREGGDGPEGAESGGQAHFISGPKQSVEHVREILQHKIDKLRSHIERLRNGRDKARKEAEALRAELEELGLAKAAEQPQWLRQAKAGIRSGAPNVRETEEEAKENLRRQAMRMELLKGLEMIHGDSELDQFQEVHQGTRTFAQKVKFTFEETLRMLTPFKRDIREIQAGYGAGIAAFFQFFRFIALINFLTMLVFLYHEISQILLYSGSLSSRQSFLPKFTFFSQFRETGNGGSLFVITMVVSLVIMTFLSLTKWVRDDEKLVLKTWFSGQESQAKYSRITLGSWDFALREKTFADDFQLNMGEVCAPPCRYGQLNFAQCLQRTIWVEFCKREPTKKSTSSTCAVQSEFCSTPCFSFSLGSQLFT
eukprot:756915_1